MTKQRSVGPTLFGALIFAAIAAGCASGGSGTPGLPAAPGSEGVDAVHRHRSHATLRLMIPRKFKRHGHAPAYISPATNSLTVGVQLATASPWPALPTQTLVVASPACGPSGSEILCNFNVDAYVGNDVFTFNAYASKSPSPSDTPLATLTSGVTKVGGDSSSLSFVLQGVVNSVVLGVPNSESSTTPIQPVPIGTATSFGLTIEPEDVSNNPIATDTFSAPVTIAVASGAPGVTLSFDKQCPGDTATATKITLNCGNDLSRVTVNYDGTITRQGAGYVDSTTISALPQPNNSPAPAAILLTSNVLGYQLVAGQGSTSYGFSNLALDPVNGKFVFSASGTGAYLYEFDPSAPASATAVPITDPLFSVLVDGSENVWGVDTYTSAIDCFTSLNPTPTQTFVPSGTPDQIALDGSGNIWYTAYAAASNYTPQIGFFNDSCTSFAPPSTQIQLSYANYTYAQFLAPAGASSMWTTTDDSPTYNLFQVNSQSIPSPTATPLLPWPTSDFPEASTSDGAYNLYTAATTNYVNTSIQEVPAAGPAFQTLNNLPPNTNAVGIVQYSSAASSAQILAIADDNYESITVLNQPFSSAEPLMFPVNAVGCGPVSFDKNGNPWLICSRADGSLWAYRPVLTSNWGPVPSTYYYEDIAQNEVLGVPESGAGSAPFTLSNYNTQVMATGTPWPVVTPGAALNHEIPVRILATGTTPVTITDGNGRSQTTTLTVLQGPYEDDGARHGHARHRHGYRPERAAPPH